MEKRWDVIQIRVNTKEKNKIRGYATLYAGGDMSMWVRYAALNAERKFLVPNKKATRQMPRGPKERTPTKQT